MSDLIKHEHNYIHVVENKVVIPKKLSITTKSRAVYLSNKNFQRIRDIKSKNEIVNTIHKYINETIMDKGVNITPKEIEWLQIRVSDDIIRNFNHYTLEEVRLSCYYGVRDELGDYFGINPTSFGVWLKNFRTELAPKVNAQMKVYLEPEKENVSTIQEKVRAVSEVLCDVHDKFVKENVYEHYDFQNLGYRLLSNLGLIDLSNQQKFDLMKETRGKLKRTFANRNHDLSLKNRNIQRIDLGRAYQQLDDKTNPTFENQVLVGAMRLAVFNYMKECVENKIDLRNLIETKISEMTIEDEKKLR
jgi:ribosomal protein S13